MRNMVLSLISVVAVSGCATVSMIPGTAVIEPKLSAEQSDLRIASDAFVQTAEDENWVQPTSGIVELAKVLMDGVSSDEKRADSYIDQIEIDLVGAEAQLVEIDADIRSATISLTGIVSEAEAFVAQPTAVDTIRRSDVMSFETSLVTAKQARSSVVEALLIVAAKGSFDLDSAQMALTDLDHAINDARKMADVLADLRAGRVVETS